MKFRTFFVAIAALILTACASPAPAGPVLVLKGIGHGVPSVGSCSAAVTAAGLQSVCNLYTSGTGPTCAGGYTTIPGSGSGTIIPGVTYGNNGGLYTLVAATSTTGAISMNCYDFSGRELYLTDDGSGQTITITNSKVDMAGMAWGYNPGGNACPSCAQFAVLTNIDFNGTGYVGGNGQLLANQGNGHISYSHFHGYAKDFFDYIGGTAEVDHNYLEACCQTSIATGAHAEAFHAGGSLTLNLHDNAWDFSQAGTNCTSGGSGGWTAGMLYGEARQSGWVQSETVTNNIVRGVTSQNAACAAAGAPQIGYILQATASGGGGASSASTWTNNVLQSGSTGYALVYLGATCTDSGNNRNYDSNTIITFC
jgi:hypothetical protein